MHLSVRLRSYFQHIYVLDCFLYVLMYALGSWLPKLMLQAGYSQACYSSLHLILAAWSVQLCFSRQISFKTCYYDHVCSAALILLGINSPQFILYSRLLVPPQLVHKSYSTPSFLSNGTSFNWHGLGIWNWRAIIGPVLTGALLTLELPWIS